MLFLPLHFHFFRDRLFGVFGLLRFLADNRFLMPAERAQYESPFGVPACIRSFPDLLLPACP